MTKSESLAYGKFVESLDPGSPGGGTNAGKGGGVILLNVTGDVEVNGIISANGGDATGSGSGGGSGGGIRISAQAIRGSGAILARGGDGSGTGGGGGGGRITLEHTSIEPKIEVFSDGGIGGNISR